MLRSARHRFPPFANRLRVALLAISFWGAIVLPGLYLPLLVLGLETVTHGLVVLALLSLNVLAVLVGRSYEPG